MRIQRQRGFFGLTGVAMYAVIGLSIALALSWAASGAAIWYLDGKVDKANEKAQEAAAALGKEEQSRQGFQAAAKSCSDSVADLEARATKAELAYAKGQGRSQALTGEVQGHITALLNRPRPEGLDECQATLRELNEEVAWRAERAAVAKKGEKP